MAQVAHKTFFDQVRQSLFRGHLTQNQVDGMERILNYRDAKWPKMIDDELAYLLATAKWETGHTMQPIEEGYPLTGDALRDYQRGLRYAPWFGRGLVQITHLVNYRKFGITKIEDAGRALEWDMALDIIFRGMILGKFGANGDKLADYIGGGKLDYVGARHIVNGTDRDDEIAAMAHKFRSALIEARKAAPAKKTEIAIGGAAAGGGVVIATTATSNDGAGVGLVIFGLAAAYVAAQWLIGKLTENRQGGEEARPQAEPTLQDIRGQMERAIDNVRYAQSQIELSMAEARKLSERMKAQIDAVQASFESAEEELHQHGGGRDQPWTPTTTTNEETSQSPSS